MTKQLRDMGGLDVEVESKRLSEAKSRTVLGGRLGGHGHLTYPTTHQ